MDASDPLGPGAALYSNDFYNCQCNNDHSYYLATSAIPHIYIYVPIEMKEEIQVSTLNYD